MQDLGWFSAMVRFKYVAVTALLIRNARKRGSVPEPLQILAPRLPGLLAQIPALLEGRVLDPETSA